MRLRFVMAFVAVVGLGMAACSVHAAVTTLVTTAYFEDADGMGIDTVPGVAGSGWNGVWATDSTGSGGKSATLDDDPLYAGSGNNLAFNAHSNNNGVNNFKASVYRRYGTASGIDPNDDHQISFALRIDDLDFLESGTGSDRLYLSGTSDKVNTHDAAKTTWDIRAQGLTVGVNDATAFQWRFQGNGDLTPNEWSGIEAVAGHLYEFTIGVNPTDYTYTGYVKDVTTGASYTTSQPLAMASTSTETGGVIGTYLLSLAEMKHDGARYHCSIDNVVISQQMTLGNLPTVVARFDGGNATDVVDAYGGMAGNGWGTAWKAATFSGDCTASATCTNVVELHPGDGNYLSVALTNNGASVASYGVSRTYRATEGLNFTKDHTIAFSIRVDEAGIGDYFSSFGGEDDKYVVTGSNAACGEITALDTFGIVAQGVDGALGMGTAGTWVFADGDGAGNVASYVGSDLRLVQYGVYDFTITMNVGSQTYDVTVTDGTTEVTKEGLHWITASDMIGGFLNFATSADGAFETRAFSLDNIVITDIGGVVSIPGDTNNDNKVDADDARTLAIHWGQPVSPGDVTVGDFNNDGIVNAADASILAANWTGSSEAAGTVPEPGMLLLLAIGGLTLAARRRRR